LCPSCVCVPVFFFQAEDGIRDFHVTGVQTCALPISALLQTGCSSVFFYPDNTTYLTPDRLNLEYEDIYLDTADGETLHGWWLPALTEAPAKGTVYFLNGNAQNVSANILNAP